MLLVKLWEAAAAWAVALRWIFLTLSQCHYSKATSGSSGVSQFLRWLLKAGPRTRHRAHDVEQLGDVPAPEASTSLCSPADL